VSSEEQRTIEKSRQRIDAPVRISWESRILIQRNIEYYSHFAMDKAGNSLANYVLVCPVYLVMTFSKKLDMIRAMMDCLLAKCIPCVTDCVMAELEKLGGKYKIALRLAKDPRFERVPCNCAKKGYADDCLTNMAQQWRCFIVATCDKELRGRIRKIPGVPCMYISGYKYTVERMPEAFGAAK
jgi:U3 small nucleolar RNA-associated protein 24